MAKVVPSRGGEAGTSSFGKSGLSLPQNGAAQLGGPVFYRLARVMHGQLTLWPACKASRQQAGLGVGPDPTLPRGRGLRRPALAPNGTEALKVIPERGW